MEGLGGGEGSKGARELGGLERGHFRGLRRLWRCLRAGRVSEWLESWERFRRRIFLTDKIN